MNHTKETMIHMAIVSAVSASVFGLILSSGAVSLDSLDVTVSVDADVRDDAIFLRYVISNVGDYDIEKITVSASCCGKRDLISDDDDALRVNSSKESLIMLSSTAGESLKNETMVLQIDAYGGAQTGNDFEFHTAEIVTVRLD